MKIKLANERESGEVVATQLFMLFGWPEMFYFDYSFRYCGKIFSNFDEAGRVQ